MGIALIDPQLGKRLIAQIKQSRIELVVALPDIVTSAAVLWPIARDPDLRLVRVCKEDEGISICAAYSYHGKRALMMMQNTGFFDSINAIRAIAIEQEMPVCMLIGLQGRAPGGSPEDAPNYGVRIMAPVLDALGIEHRFIQAPEEAPVLGEMIEKAYGQSRPTVVLV